MKQVLKATILLTLSLLSYSIRSYTRNVFTSKSCSRSTICEYRYIQISLTDSHCVACSMHVFALFIFSLDFQFPLIFVFCRAKLKGLRLKYRYTEANMRKAIQEERTKKKEFSHWRFKKQKAVFKRLLNKLHGVVSNFYCQIVCMSTQLNFV